MLITTKNHHLQRLSWKSDDGSSSSVVVETPTAIDSLTSLSATRRQGVGFHLDGVKLESDSNLKETSFIIDLKLYYVIMILKELINPWCFIYVTFVHGVGLQIMSLVFLHQSKLGK
ncbi:hypothetical protein GLYMA_13G262650v4 [Glycine max]|nr:hypothetical protein GLYMA_13G262650v4 [Glycine max]KAH1103482.1 hypothetical protein GYH30_037436 [Glycine max]